MITKEQIVLSRKEKLLKRIKSQPKDFTWDELVTLLASLNFEELVKSKTGGSRRKFYHAEKNLIINLHKPHPSPIIKAYAIAQIIEKLEEENVI
jgi:hypothetical protein